MALVAAMKAAIGHLHQFSSVGQHRVRLDFDEIQVKVALLDMKLPVSEDGTSSAEALAADLSNRLAIRARFVN